MGATLDKVTSSRHRTGSLIEASSTMSTTEAPRVPAPDSRVTRRRAVAIAIAAAASLIAAARPAAAADTICDITAPEGWNLIGEASSTQAGEQFVCNYKVDRPSGQSGTAITIEYFCTPEDASARFGGVVGHRDNVTTPPGAPPGTLVVEEGRQARNPDNRQADGVFSSFFPGVEFGLFEKEWSLLNQQVFATIVVLTNERGRVAEEERFGVDDAEIVARILANRNRGAAGCPIPEVPAAGSSGTSPPTIPIIVGTVGVIIVIGGTRLIWRRKGEPKRPADHGPVPERCRGVAAQYEDSRDRLATLREASRDLGEQLQRAEIIHANNIIKANMVVGFEVGSVIGGTVGDLAQAVGRPRGASPAQQLDTWRPPSKLGANMAKALQLAEEALELAKNKARLVAEQLAAIRSKVDDLVENSTVVRNARQLHEYWTNKLTSALEDLPKANAARKRYADLDALAKKQGALVAKGAAVRAPLERAVLQGAAELEGLEALANKAVSPMKDELAALDKHMKAIDDARTMGPGGKKLPLAPDRARQIERMQEMRGELLERISEVELEHGRGISEHKRKLDATKKQLQELDDQPGWKELLADRQRTSTELQDAAAELHRLEEVSEADVRHFREQANRYANQLLEARAAGKMQEMADVDHVARRLEQARFNEMLAQDALDNLRRSAESLEVGGAPRVPGGAEQGWSIGRAVRWPIRVLGELVFGVGQSPEEIVAILRKGFANIEILRKGYTAITTEGDAEHGKAVKLRQALDDCIKTGSQDASPPAPSPSAPSMSAPTRPGPAPAPKAQGPTG